MARHPDCWRACLAVVAVALAGAAHAAPPLEIRIDSGRIRGESSGDVRVFRGIPFAAPPVGERRWRDPVRPEAWPEVRDATRFGARCMQRAGSVGGRIGEATASQPTSEDCLYLNVWTPPASRERRPVVVWMHGGSYVIGTGSQFEATQFARRGVVVVTFNYRLNAFGFMAHPLLSTESKRRSSGNYGLADAVAALDWVKRNIAQFGGDPRLVTVAGQSAGGRLIQDLMTSPCAPGLFKRAILQSAPVRVITMTSLADAERAGSDAAAKAGATTLAQLRALSAEQVLENLPAGQPIIDNHCIVEDPLRAFDTGQSRKADLLVGSNADEGTFPYLRPQQFGIGFPTVAEYSDYVRGRFGPDSEELLRLYPAADVSSFESAQREAFRDESAWIARFFAQSHTRHRKGRAFVYYFMHRPPAPEQGPDRGATHGSEIPYVFDNPRPGWTDDDRRVAGIMAAYWANFALRGDPNGPGLPVWPTFDAATGGQRMNLGPMTAGPVLDARRVALFDALFERAGKKRGGGE